MPTRLGVERSSDLKWRRPDHLGLSTQLSRCLTHRLDGARARASRTSASPRPRCRPPGRRPGSPRARRRGAGGSPMAATGAPRRAAAQPLWPEALAFLADRVGDPVGDRHERLAGLHRERRLGHGQAANAPSSVPGRADLADPVAGSGRAAADDRPTAIVLPSAEMRRQSAVQTDSERPRLSAASTCWRTCPGDGRIPRRCAPCGGPATSPRLLRRPFR